MKSSHSTCSELLNMPEVTALLEGLFDLFNTSYYEGRLPKPVITVQSTPRAYGHCSTKQIWSAADAEPRYEINLGAESLNRPLKATAATLQHEMVHLFCLEHHIEDTCQKGRYHNKRFKIEAERRDLILEYSTANGYSHTTPGEGLIARLTENGFDVDRTFFVRNTPQAIRAKRPQKKIYKYTYPVCGVTVKSDVPVNIKCSDCDQIMEL